MLHRIRIALAALAATALTVAGAGVATAQPAPVPTPSVAQLCAAAGVATIDALLAGVAETELVGGLAPLADLTVPRPTGGVQLDLEVATLPVVRDALGCDTPPVTTVPPTPTPTATPTAEPTLPDGPRYDSCAAARAAGADPLLIGDPGYRPALDADGDGFACESDETDGFAQTPLVPSGGVATGDGSAQR